MFQSQVEIILLKYRKLGSLECIGNNQCFNLKLRLFYLSTLVNNSIPSDFTSSKFQSQVEIILLKYRCFCIIFSNPNGCFNLKLRLFYLSTATYGTTPIFDQPIRQNWPRRTVSFDRFTSHLRLFSLSTATYEHTPILRPANSSELAKANLTVRQFHISS